MQENYSGTTYVPPQRSSFLTVLCILSFLGSGYGIISNVMSYATADTVATVAADEFKRETKDVDKSDAPPFAKKMVKEAGMFMNAESLKKNAIIGVIANLLTFAGAFLMFRMKPAGFWTYVVGTVFGVAGPLFVFGNSMIAGIAALIPGLIGLAFIVMYAFNLKDMKPQPVFD